MAKLIAGRWNRGKILRRGGQGVIYHVEDTQGKYKGKVVLKRLHYTRKKGRLANKRKERLAKEIETTKYLHKEEVSVVEIVDDYLISDPNAESPWFVMPYYKKGNLDSYIKTGEPYGGSETSAIKMIRKIVSVVKDIHKHEVAHRDLKPANILMKSAEDIVLADFGLCLPLNPEIGNRLTGELEKIGSLHYTPLEAYSGKQEADQRQYAYDIFAVGKIFYYLLTGVALPGFKFPVEKPYDIKDKEPIGFYKMVSFLLRGLLHEDPKQRRITWRDIDKHLDILGESLDPQKTGEENTFRERIMKLGESIQSSQEVEKEIQQKEQLKEIDSSCKDIIGIIFDELKQSENYILMREQILENTGGIFRCNLGKGQPFGIWGAPFQTNIDQKPFKDAGYVGRVQIRGNCILSFIPNDKITPSVPSVQTLIEVSFTGDKFQFVSMVSMIQKENNKAKNCVVEGSTNVFHSNTPDVEFVQKAIQASLETSKIWLDIVTEKLGKYFTDEKK